MSAKHPLLGLILVLFLAGVLRADCPVGDLNEDCRVDFEDVRLLASRWLDAGCLAPDCGADLNGRAGVNMSDFALLAQSWRGRGRITLVINEFMADNAATIADPDESGEYPDWIEIYNYGSDSIDIGGMYISDDLDSQSRRRRIPSGFGDLTTIGPGGYLLIWADNDPEQGPLHVDFALRAGGGEDVALFDEKGAMIDAVAAFPAQAADGSYGRFPDASDTWEVFEDPTPGKANQRQPVNVLISEIMYHPYHPTSGSEDIRLEYIELFNAGSEPVDLSGWRFTDGVDFTFPNDVTVDAGQCIVVAADVNAFKAKYPDVNNVVGGWQGRLSNQGEEIELVDAGLILVDKVHYAGKGDWAVRQLAPADYGHRGWEWSDAHDGGGKSLELVSPTLPNEYGQNWSASNSSDGTPGRTNSVNNKDIAPLILNVKHFPLIPGPNDIVTVTARIIDELNIGTTASLYYRIDHSKYEDRDVYPRHDPSEYNDVPMFDDGTHGDSAAGDGIYAAQILPRPDRTIIEFYVEARDAADHTRTWPAPSMVDSTQQQVTNVLYQVDASFDADAFSAAGSQPIYYLIMTEMERGRLAYIGNQSYDSYSHAQMNGTFISIDGVDTKLHYNVGIRNRGKGSRRPPPNNYRINFCRDRPWKNVTAININSKYTYLQLLGDALFQMADLAALNAAAIQVRVNGENLALLDPDRMHGLYVHLEVYDTDWAENHFPQDATGNLYRCVSNNRNCDLQYLGDDPNEYSQPDYYEKAANSAINDWSDLIELTYVLDQWPDDTYVERAASVINVDQWLRWLALQTMLSNKETNLSNGYGDDYYMYRGVLEPRFILLPYDLDNICHPVDSNGSIWLDGKIDRLPVVKRFITHPEFVARYYRQLKELCETTFAVENFDPLVDHLLGNWVPTSKINEMKNFAAARRQYVLSVIPQQFTIGSDLPVNKGYHFTQIPVAAGDNIKGSADAINSRSVLVNGTLAEWSQIDGKWSQGQTILPLKPGINRVIIQTFDSRNGTGNELERGFVDIWYDDGNVSEISGTLTTDVTLDAESGPWHVAGDVQVPAGVTLNIEKGTTVFFDAAAGITVSGRLIAEGTQYERIRLTRVPGSSAYWNGLVFGNSLQDNRLCYIDMEFGDSSAQAIKIDHAQILIDNLTWSRTSKKILDVVHPRLIVRNSIFPDHDNEEQLYGHGLTGTEYLILEGNTFGRLSGYQDAIDFADCHRPGPIPQVHNNVFLGGEDDALDLDNADAHIEGNVFMNFLGGSGTGTANPIAADQGSQIVAVRNVFYNNINAVLVKGNAEIQAEHNTFVGQTGSVINFSELGSASGKAAYLDGNIFWNNASVFQTVGGQVELALHRSIVPAEWHHLGDGNIEADPLFVDPNADFHLKPSSPAIGTGPCGINMGAYARPGAAVCGEPDTVADHTDAVLTVGGPGITHYKYAVNNSSGPWSEERPVEAPIELTGLVDGQSYTVYVLGANSAGVWQSSPAASRAWTVDTSYRRLVINEVLAHTHGSDPDLIELYYDGSGPLDLSGMSLSDDPLQARKFIFSNQTLSKTILNPGDYMLLYGDFDTQLRDHVGFALSAEGEGLYLYDKPSNGGDLVDSVVFGPQINGFSIGRIGYSFDFAQERGRQWKLNQPTFGQANIAASLGDPDRLRINEWLTHGEVLFEDDFLELYNPQAAAVELSGLCLTDNPISQAAKHIIGPLSFIGAGGSAIFVADGTDAPSHVDLGPRPAGTLKLSADGGIIALFDSKLNEIDKIIYGPQMTDVSQGRAPDGAKTFEFFELPTPGVANPLSTTRTVTLAAENADKRVLVPTGDIGDTWRSDPDFNALSWSVCTGDPGGVGYERGSGYERYFSLDVADQMYSRNDTCYIRIPFSISDDPDTFTKIVLAARHDDGFIAYINGAEVARRNFSGTPSWNSGASASHSDSAAVLFEDIDISGYTSSLRQGNNLLAIHGLNNSANRSDFLVSAEMVATIATSQDEYLAKAFALLDGLRITELMYHAAAGSNYDYIELQNVSDVTLDLTGVRLVKGIELTFPAMELEPGEYVVAAGDVAAFRSEYGPGARVTGPYIGNLSNSGEDIVLVLPWPLEAAIMRFSYDDLWYPLTDGQGKSLVIRDPSAHPATWNRAESWHQADPTPGKP